jgi:mRNA interferase MazF
MTLLEPSSRKSRPGAPEAFGVLARRDRACAARDAGARHAQGLRKVAGRAASGRSWGVGRQGGGDATVLQTKAFPERTKKGAAVKQCETWWAELPAPIGKRAVILLSRDSAYEYLHRVLAVEVTSRVRGIPQEIALAAREGLPQRCVGNLENLRAVPKNAFTRASGSASASAGRRAETSARVRARMDRVDDALAIPAVQLLQRAARRSELVGLDDDERQFSATGAGRRRVGRQWARG